MTRKELEARVRELEAERAQLLQTVEEQRARIATASAVCTKAGIENAELRAFRAEVLDVCSSATLARCDGCSGVGITHRVYHDGFGALRIENVTCATCGGSGLSLP